MRKLHYRIAAVVTAALSVPFLASAAHASSCPLVSDAFNDGAWLTPSIQSPTFDIRSLDLASGATTLVAVLRVGALPSGQTGGPFGFGQKYIVAWDIGSTFYAVEARFSGSSVISRFTVGGVDAGAAPLALDPSTGTLTWTLARGNVPGLTGATLELPRAVSSWMGTSTDNAIDATATYVDGTAGCVPAA